MVSTITLKEEPVPAQISAIDTTQGLNTAAKSVGRSGSSSPFAEIMAQLTKATLAKGRTTAAATGQVAASSETVVSDSTAAQQVPIKTLENSLRSTGQPLEKFQVAASDRDKLEQVLLQSGYGSEDVTQVMERSSNSDGSINLGVLFANLAQYMPTQGPLLLLNQSDAPLLTQVLKDLGVDQNKIQQYMDNLPKQGDQLVVQGLPELLAQVDPDQTKAVDQSYLSDLLTHMGLSQSDAQSLLTRATDSQGRTTAPAVMALLSVAALRQEKGQSLQDLAASLQLAKASQSQASDADHLRAQVIQSLQKIEAQVSAQTQSLSQHWQEALEQAQQALKGLGNGQTYAQAQGQGLGLASGLGQGQSMGQSMGQSLEQSLGLPALLRQALGEAGVSWELGQQARAQGQAQAGQVVDHSLAVAQELAAGESGQAQPAARAEALATSGQAAQKATQSDISQGATSRPVENSRAGDGLNLFNQSLTQAEEAAGARPTLPAYVVRQVGQQIVQMVSRQENSLRLELKPPSLGEVNLELSVKDGVVKASVVTDTVAAKQALENGLDQLKQQLTMQGLKVESVEITVNPDAQRQQTQAQADQERRRQATGRVGGVGGAGGEAAVGDGEQSLAAALAAASASSSRINLFA